MHFLCKKLYMRVLVLANDGSREELTALSMASSLQLQWVTRPEEYVGGPVPDACIDLLFENETGRIDWLKGLGTGLIIINSVIHTLEKMNGKLIRINGWPGFLKRPVAEMATNDDTLKKKAEELFGLLSRTTEWVPDIPGFVTPRIVASIINEAFFALEEGVSTEEEIDIAMKLGTNYPYGPFEWCKKIGLKNIHSLLATLEIQQNRYHPSALLTHKALA